MTQRTGDQDDTVRPMADYSSVTRHGHLVFTAGMTPRIGDRMAFTGCVGGEVDAEAGHRAAEIAAERALTAIWQRYPDADVVPLQLTVYIAAAPHFDDLSAVADGASAVLAARTGALPARAAVGVARLPGRAPVEVALIASLSSRPTPVPPRQRDAG